MSQLPDGGPAFPIINTPDTMREWEGMSLEDYFAGQIVAGYLGSYGDAPFPEEHERAWLAGSVYGLAGAMLAERKRRIEARGEAQTAIAIENERRRTVLKEECLDLWDSFQGEEISLDDAWAQYELRSKEAKR
jgi:hypothetical protein